MRLVRHFLAALCLTGVAALVHAAPAAQRPDIVLIVADDLGYSDLGAYGGEIPTPNLDRLAARGLQYTHFHAGPTCSPTRAMLMSGIDHHRAGLGAMAEVLRFNPQMIGKPGYEGHLNDRVTTIAQRLLDAGYATRIAGKWHLGQEPADLPSARGFEKSYVLLPGGAQHFDAKKALPFDADATLREDGRVASWPEGRFSSDYYTDRMIEYVRGAPAERPLFAYMAYTAPHWPLQAPAADIAKQKGRYDAGWDDVRAKRLERQRTLGLIAEPASAAPRPASVPAWETLSDDAREHESRVMEIYAAMVENLDRNVGRLLDALDERGRLDDTIIVFMSDNGAEAMRPERSALPALSEWIAKNFDNRLENLGSATSYVGYGPSWAHVSNTPTRGYKGGPYEGGTRVPAIIVLPGGQPQKIHDFAHVLDLPPTLLALAGVPLKGVEFDGRQIIDADGRPLPADASRVSNTELFGHRSVRRGTLKAVAPWLGAEGHAPWQLYDLALDPGEQQDLAPNHPRDVQALAVLHAQWELEQGVILPAKSAQGYGIE